MISLSQYLSSGFRFVQYTLGSGLGFGTFLGFRKIQDNNYIRYDHQIDCLMPDFWHQPIRHSSMSVTDLKTPCTYLLECKSNSGPEQFVSFLIELN